MAGFSWPMFFALVCAALVLGLGMGQLYDVLAPCRSREDDAVISREACTAISIALQHWSQVQRRGDEHWNATFVMLNEAFSHAAYVDVRLYMYALSDEAAELFRAYERETFD